MDYLFPVKRQALNPDVHIKSFDEELPRFCRIQVAVGTLAIVSQPYSWVERLRAILPEDLHQMSPLQHGCVLDGTVHVAGPCREISSATCYDRSWAKGI